MKQNKTIIDLIKRAYANAQGESAVRRNGIEIYRITRDDNSIKLFHYGTLIASIVNGRAEIGSGAYSASDRDAINNFFEYHGVNKRVCIKNGVLQEIA